MCAAGTVFAQICPSNFDQADWVEKTGNNCCAGPCGFTICMSEPQQHLWEEAVTAADWELMAVGREGASDFSTMDSAAHCTCFSADGREKDCQVCSTGSISPDQNVRLKLSQ